MTAPPDRASGDREERIWTCKIGGPVFDLPHGADLPMREAVKSAFHGVTGCVYEFLFSGWGGSLDECERAVVEKRAPIHEKTEYAKAAREEKLREALADLQEDADRLNWLLKHAYGRTLGRGADDWDYVPLDTREKVDAARALLEGSPQ